MATVAGASQDQVHMSGDSMLADAERPDAPPKSFMEMQLEKKMLRQQRKEEEKAKELQKNITSDGDQVRCQCLEYVCLFPCLNIALTTYLRLLLCLLCRILRQFPSRIDQNRTCQS